MNMKLNQPFSGGIHRNTLQDDSQLNKVYSQAFKWSTPQPLGGRPPAHRSSMQTEKGYVGGWV